MILDIIEMDGIRLKILQDPADFLPCLRRIEDPEGGGKVFPDALRKIHISDIGARGIAHGVLIVLKSKILNLMAMGFQHPAYGEHIGLGAALGIQKFID